MIYALIVSVFLLGQDEPRFYTPNDAGALTIEQCRALGVRAVERFAEIDGVAGAAFLCAPVGDPV